ncbi:MAG: hypothetical protein AAGP08_14625, partial [Pseudomonadota bacterium]
HERHCLMMQSQSWNLAPISTNARVFGASRPKHAKFAHARANLIPRYLSRMDDDQLPRLALSVRQPWAWAILFGGKVIENRSLGAIRAGRMTPGVICLHAATGMTEKEFRWGQWRLDKHGVRCPPPADLPRGAIVGTVEVTGIITDNDSEWFGGQAGLTIAHPRPIDPIPAKGALGYFEWSRQGALAAPVSWMRRYETLGLFPDDPPSFETAPPKPFGTKSTS